MTGGSSLFDSPPRSQTSRSVSPATSLNSGSSGSMTCPSANSPKRNDGEPTDRTNRCIPRSAQTSSDEECCDWVRGAPPHASTEEGSGGQNSGRSCDDIIERVNYTHASHSYIWATIMVIVFCRRRKNDCGEGLREAYLAMIAHCHSGVRSFACSTNVIASGPHDIAISICRLISALRQKVYANDRAAIAIALTGVRVDDPQLASLSLYLRGLYSSPSI